jgi:hypothetical protein
MALLSWIRKRKADSPVSAPRPERRSSSSRLLGRYFRGAPQATGAGLTPTTSRSDPLTIIGKDLQDIQPLVSDGKKNAELQAGKDTSCNVVVEHVETQATSRSLWDEAYEALKTDDASLVESYEKKVLGTLSGKTRCTHYIRITTRPF